MARHAETSGRPRERTGEDRATVPSSVLSRLGIFGWQGIEPAIIAALATEEPVLLIGPHGTAKSLLLNRLAEALGLRHRHYNASLLNFDDLAGYPVPSEDRARLVYVPTASSVWDAESVLFDEISRCRVDLQNKLFPIIHERVVQGLPLTNLRHRWAAMNPPPPDGADEDEDGLETYRGSEPLDPALADRFPFVIEVPEFNAMTEAERRAVIAGAAGRPDGEGAARLRLSVETTRRCLGTVRDQLCRAACDYVAALLPLLEKLRRKISPRRARYLHDAIVATHAARLGCDLRAEPRDSAYLALRCGLSHTASGRPVEASKLLAAHRQAWAIAGLPESDPTRLVLSEPDPVRRVALGLRAGLPAPELSTAVLDAFAELPGWKRVAFAAALFPVASRNADLSTAAFEALADVQAQIEDPRERNHALVPGSRRFELWRKITHALAGLGNRTPADRTLRNVLLVAFERDEGDFQPQEVARYFRDLAQLFGWRDDA